MITQTDLMLVEEFSDQELELISGGQKPDLSIIGQKGLVNVAVSDVTVNVALVALNAAPVFVAQED